jgi:hypothetical protein
VKIKMLVAMPHDDVVAVLARGVPKQATKAGEHEAALFLPLFAQEFRKAWPGLWMETSWKLLSWIPGQTFLLELKYYVPSDSWPPRKEIAERIPFSSQDTKASPKWQTVEGAVRKQVQQMVTPLLAERLFKKLDDGPFAVQAALSLPPNRTHLVSWWLKESQERRKRHAFLRKQTYLQTRQ